MRDYPQHRRTVVIGLAEKIDVVVEEPPVITPSNRLDVYTTHLYEGTLTCIHLGILWNVFCAYIHLQHME